MFKRILNYFRDENIYQKMVNYKKDIPIEEMDTESKKHMVRKKVSSIIANINWICGDWILGNHFYSFSYYIDYDRTNFSCDTDMYFNINGYEIVFPNFNNTDINTEIIIYDIRELRSRLQEELKIFHTPNYLDIEYYIKLDKDLNNLGKKLIKQKIRG
jgi:hypothetical protein